MIHLVLSDLFYILIFNKKHSNILFCFITRMGRPKFAIAASVALINAITVGICSTYSSTATESMKSSFLKPTDAEISWIGSTVPLAAMFGGILAGKF